MFSDQEIRLILCKDLSIPLDTPVDADLTQFVSNFDSLKLIELVATLEELAGLQVGEAPNEYPIISTLQQAVDYFRGLCEL